MERDLLPHVPIVLAVARRRSFAAAAAELGLSASAVSHAVRAVERRLGAPLFARTTRSVAPTEIGALFVARAAAALADLDELWDGLRATRGEVAGVLRLNAPRVAWPMALLPLVAALSRRHPQLTVEVVSDDGLADIVAEGFDAGVRLGEMISQDMATARLTPPFRAVVVASPAYLDAHGRPASLADLARHNCVGYRLLSGGGVYGWELRDGSADVAVAVRGSARVTDATAARELALAGIGLAYLFEPLVAADLLAGRLEIVLEDAAILEPGLFAYFPRRAAQQPKLRAFLDAARDFIARKIR